MPQYYPLEFSELDEKLRSSLPEDAPVGRRIAAAKGLIPLGTKELLTALYYLCGDPDKRVRKEAQASLRELPESLTLIGIGAGLSPKILHFLASRRYDNHHIQEKVALTKNATDETLALLAEQCPHESVIEIIGRNEQAVLRCPKILYGLAKNPKAPRSLVDRLSNSYQIEKGRPFTDDLSEEERAELEAAGPEPAQPPPEEIPPPTAEEPRDILFEVPDDRLHPCFRIEDLLSADFDTAELFADDLLKEPEKSLDESKRMPLFQRIARLSMVDRLLLAMHGNSEARKFLIKSPQKMIQDCVLRNQKLTISEVVAMVKERSSSQNVIETICRNREWMRYNEIVAQIVWHPKTPVHYVSKFMGRLSTVELSRVAGSKMVPTATALHAKAILKRRERT